MMPERVGRRRRRMPTTEAAVAPTASVPTPPSIDHDGARAFLYREARLLDERQWDDWLALWQPGARYAMPTRSSRAQLDPTAGVAAELTAEGGAWWFDETPDSVTIRIAKLKTGKAWTEEPPSRTRRHVSNIEVEPADQPGSGALVRSNLLIYRGRRDSDVEWFSCGRVDRIVPVDGALRLASRRVVIDTNVVPADNLMLFF